MWFVIHTEQYALTPSSAINWSYIRFLINVQIRFLINVQTFLINVQKCFPGIMLGKKCPQAFSVYILHPTTLWPWTQYFIPLNFTFLLQNKVIVCATRMLSPSPYAFLRLVLPFEPFVSSRCLKSISLNPRETCMSASSCSLFYSHGGAPIDW